MTELKMEHVLMLLGAYLVYHFLKRRCPFYELEGFQCKFPEKCTTQEDCSCGGNTHSCDPITKKCQPWRGDTGFRYCDYNARKFLQEGECQIGQTPVVYNSVGWVGGGTNGEGPAKKLSDCKTVNIDFLDTTAQRWKECSENAQLAK